MNFAFSRTPRIIHIHGSIKDIGGDGEGKGLVFKTADYLIRYADPKFRESITKLFNGSKTIVFIGYGLSEMQLLDFLVNSSRKATENTRFFLKGYFSQEEPLFLAEQAYFQEAFQINLISFNKDKNNYEELIEVLDKLLAEANTSTKKEENNFRTALEIIRGEPNKKRKDELEQTIAPMQKEDLLGVLKDTINTPYYQRWIPWMYYSSNAYKPIFSFLENLKPSIVTSGYISEVDFPALELLYYAFSKEKDVILLSFSKKVLSSLFIFFEKNKNLRSNFRVMDLIVEWIFSDYRLINWNKSYGFIKNVLSSVTPADDWVRLIGFDSNELVKSSNSTIKKYLKLALEDSFSIKNNRSASFELFVGYLGERIAKKCPSLVFSTVLPFVKNNVSLGLATFNSIGTFDDIENDKTEGSNELYQSTVFLLMMSTNWLDDSFIIKKQKEWAKSSNLLLKNLSIYLCGVHYDKYKNLFFDNAKSYLKERRTFSNAYCFVKKHLNDFSDDELKILKNISAWLCNNGDEHYEKGCGYYLLLLLNESDKFKSTLENNERSIPIESKFYLSLFPKPEDISKDIWSVNLPDDYEKKEEEKFTKAKDVVDYIRLVNESKTSRDSFTISHSFADCAKNLNLYKWLVSNLEKNLNLLPKEVVNLLPNNEGVNQIGIAALYGVFQKYLDSNHFDEAAKLFTSSANYLFSNKESLSKLTSQKDNGILFDYLIKGLRKNYISFDSQKMPEDSSVISFLYERGLGALLTDLLQTVEASTSPTLLATFDSLLDSSNTSCIAKICVSTFIGEFWTLSSTWTSKNMSRVFDNQKGDINLSILGFTDSLFSQSAFILELAKQKLLNKILCSSEFSKSSNAYNFVWNILFHFLNKELNNDIVKDAVSSSVSPAALQVINRNLLVTGNFYKPTFSDYFETLCQLAEKYAPVDVHSSLLVIQYLKFYKKAHDKVLMIKLARKFSLNFKTAYIKEFKECLSNSCIPNSDMKQIISDVLESLTENFYHVSEIVDVLNLANWTDDMTSKQKIINILSSKNSEFRTIS